jgi:hypothetical protein
VAARCDRVVPSLPLVCRVEAAPTRRLAELSLIGQASGVRSSTYVNANDKPGDVAMGGNLRIPDIS